MEAKIRETHTHIGRKEENERDRQTDRQIDRDKEKERDKKNESRPFKPIIICRL